MSRSCGQAGAVVDAKAPADAAAFKGWLRQISQHVAEAAAEGGFLGFGGVAVSDAEKATLMEISGVLKLPAALPPRTAPVGSKDHNLLRAAVIRG